MEKRVKLDDIVNKFEGLKDGLACLDESLGSLVKDNLSAEDKSDYMSQGQDVVRMMAENIDELRELYMHGYRQSLTDQLTGLPLRRARELYLEGLKKQMSGQNIYIIYFDLNNFKEINDKIGHNEGDSALRQVGLTLAANIARDDFACRTGGDEFQAIISAKEDINAYLIARRLMTQIDEALESFKRYHGIDLTTSVGVSKWNIPNESFEDAEKRADAGMYESKEQIKDIGQHEVKFTRE